MLSFCHDALDEKVTIEESLKLGSIRDVSLNVGRCHGVHHAGPATAVNTNCGQQSNRSNLYPQPAHISEIPHFRHNRRSHWSKYGDCGK
jgi:hypothetical protein